MGDTAGDRLAEALRRINDSNREDPRTETIGGLAVPKELAFADCVEKWVRRLLEHPSDELRLAARAHTLRRWMIPRDRYPKTTAGYHQWRHALAQFHAEQAASILRDVGYDEPVLTRLRDLITKKNWMKDPEGRALEDADCLAFLELKLANYLDEWDEEKTVDILRKTLGKMTPKARELAASLHLDPRCEALLRQASSDVP